MNSKKLLILLKFLADNCGQLFEFHQLRITHSDVGSTHVAGASILLESEAVKIFLTVEKEQIELKFCSIYEGKGRWHIFERISKLLGYEVIVGIMDEPNTSFLRKNGNRIMELFDKENYAHTVKKLDQFQDEWLANLQARAISANTKLGQF